MSTRPIRRHHAAGDFPEFVWATGEECSTPLVYFDNSLVRVDELETTGHLAGMESDLADVASLGIRYFRYGMPWYRCEPEPGVYDWSLWDRALSACEETGLEPIVDFVHFGLPDHYPGFCESSWIDGLKRYVEAFLARYPLPRFFTPVNEPAVTALQSAMTGVWNDRRSGPVEFVRALANCLQADLEVAALIRQDREGWNVMAEGFSIWSTTDDASREVARSLNAAWQLTWDLRFGVEPEESALGLLEAVDDTQLARISELATRHNVVAGHDFYPPSVISLGAPVSLDVDGKIAAYESAARRWHARYCIDFWIAETSNLGLPAEEGPRWLEGIAAAVGRMRADGIPLRGICWYSRGDQHDWDSALLKPVGKVTEVGLFDIARRRRPVAGVFESLAVKGPPHPASLQD